VVNEPGSPYSLTPVSAKSQKLLRSPRKASRKISKIPFKVLDAPELQDDFYLNLVDWSSQNVLSVGLGACVYLWSACTSQVKLNIVTSYRYRWYCFSCTSRNFESYWRT
jgi:cell division cycle 20-like protein 1, cofactor of APC complex